MKKQQPLGFGDKKKAGPVECLGQTFESDDSRREHYLTLLAEKLKDPEFRKTPGFPKGTDEDILLLSDPPYYTACPNPFLAEVVSRLRPASADGHDIHVPYAADVSEGKSDPIYNSHSYHTKVPPSAIERFLEHYTRPGDVVLDCFCGTGMTGVACSARGKASADTSRIALLADLSPLATHIAANTTSPLDTETALSELNEVLDALEAEFGDLYASFTDDGVSDGTIDYLVWTEWFHCSHCGTPLSFYDALVEHGESGRLTRFPCTSCGSDQVKQTLRPVMETVFDPVLRRAISATRTTPVIAVVRTHGGSRVRRQVSTGDMAHLERVRTSLATAPVPVVEIPFMHMTHERNDLPGKGITHVHHFYTWRNLLLMSYVWSRLESPWSRFVFTSVCDRHAVRRNRFIFNEHNPNGRVNGPLSNTLFVPPLQVEMNVFSIFRRKIDDLLRTASEGRPVRMRSSFITTQSATSLSNIPDAVVDYAFVDPPFGGNILYSDLNIIAESWLGVRTAREPEAVVDDSRGRGKGFLDYQHTMTACFLELQKKLKPGRWITVEFHNSSNAIWTAIQSAIGAAGLVVADVRFFDKGSGTIHQDSKASAVKKDLLISAYRPREEFEHGFALTQGSAEGVWAFVAEHLRNLPLFVAVGADAVGVVPDRTDQVLFDRMIGFHVQRSVAVPLGSADFFAGLGSRYPKRDGMYFLADQVAEYDRKRTSVSELRQLELFVSDEASATQWVRQQLQAKPQSFQDLQPQFMQHLQAWAKHEKTIELKEILALNFFRYDGRGPVPSQIHSYLSTNFREYRNLGKEDPVLRAKAEDRWYVPDPSKEADLEKLRLRTLLKEFEDYRSSTSRKLKQFRSEAVRAGFKHCYDSQDYQTIVDVAAKLPEQVIQEDEKLLMYFDVATMRLGVEG